MSPEALQAKTPFKTIPVYLLKLYKSLSKHGKSYS